MHTCHKTSITELTRTIYLRQASTWNRPSFLQSDRQSVARKTHRKVRYLAPERQTAGENFTELIGRVQMRFVQQTDQLTV